METLAQVFTVKNIVIYLICINLIGFLAMFIDKKKAENGSWRIQERTLITIAFIGGSIGSLIGMYTFKHKTQKPRFKIGFPVILAIQIAIVIYLLIIF